MKHRSSSNRKACFCLSLPLRLTAHAQFGPANHVVARLTNRNCLTVPLFHSHSINEENEKSRVSLILTHRL